MSSSVPPESEMDHFAPRYDVSFAVRPSVFHVVVVAERNPAITSEDSSETRTMDGISDFPVDDPFHPTL